MYKTNNKYSKNILPWYSFTSDNENINNRAKNQILANYSILSMSFEDSGVDAQLLLKTKNFSESTLNFISKVMINLKNELGLPVKVNMFIDDKWVEIDIDKKS